MKNWYSKLPLICGIGWYSNHDNQTDYAEPNTYILSDKYIYGTELC